MNKDYFTNLNYNFISNREKNNKKRLKCMFPDCNKKAVMSHTIPESAVLKILSNKDNVLYYPEIDNKTKKYLIGKTYTRKASVFPGFCNEHENLFSGYEKDGNFQDQSIVLQNLRVIYRYYSRWDNLKKTFNYHKKKYTEEIFKYQKEKIDFLNQYQKSDIKLMSIEDDIIEHINKNIDLCDYMIQKIHNEDLYPFLRTLNGDDNLISVGILEINIPLPLSLAGKSEFDINGKKFTIHLSVFSTNNKTILCFSYNLKYEKEFNTLLSQYKNDIEIIGFIESWMIYGTDDWFINPNEWDSYTKIKQDKILDLLKVQDYYPDKKLDFNIFDNARNYYNKS